MKNAKTVLTIAIVAVLACLILPAIAISVRGFREDLFRADVGVVFGSDLSDAGAPTAEMAGRLDRAAELYDAGAFDAIVVCRAGGGDGAVLADYLIGKGIPRPSIYISDGASNTRGTARSASALMSERGWTRAIAISQFFHIARAVMTLKAEGADEVGCAYSMVFGIGDIISIAREVPAIYAYAVGLK